MPRVQSHSQPILLQTGRDYYICLVMGEKQVRILVADLTAGTPLSSHAALPAQMMENRLRTFQNFTALIRRRR